MRSASIAFLIVLSFVTISASVAFLDEFPRSYTWSELLLNYQGGFMKRALIGEVAYRLRSIIPPREFIFSVVLTAYLAASAVAALALRLPAKLSGILMLVSPASFLFPIYDEAAFGRKDAFVVLIIVLSAWIALSKMRLPMALITAMVLFGMTGLVSETVWFYYPLASLPIVVRREGRLAMSAGIWVGTCVIGAGLAVAMQAANGHGEALIAASWQAIYPDAFQTPGALCCLGARPSDALSMAAVVFLHRMPLASYVLATVLALVPVAVLIAEGAVSGMSRGVIAMLMAATAASMLPLLLAADWGRFISLFSTALFFSLWSLQPTRQAKPLSLFAMSGAAAAIIVFGASWRLLHWTEVGSSALRWPLF